MGTEDRDVWVTGLGCVSSLGHTFATTWEAISKGVSGIQRIAGFDPSPYACQIAGEVRGFKPQGFLDPKELRRHDPFTQYALVAALEALKHAGFFIENTDWPEPERVGVVLGTSIGGIREMTQNAVALARSARLSPTFVASALPNAAATAVSLHCHTQGPCMTVSTACASSAHALGMAKHWIEQGRADVMIAGGTDHTIVPLTIAGHVLVHALATTFNADPARASRPWDAQREGFILGDGAGILLLEAADHARKRGAIPLARLAGYGMTADAHHIIAPHPEGRGAAACMRQALQEARLMPEDIDYINAHGTSTVAGDTAETAAIKAVFGQNTRIPVSSTKSMTGHLLGAAGALEAVFSVAALQNSLIPPTINLEEPDRAAGCTLDYVPHEARQASLRSVLSNSFGFGGVNGCLIFTQP